MTEKSDRPNYRPELDGLRAIAALMVLVFHFYLDVLPGRFIGVDIFFCISGFLITRKLLLDMEGQKLSLLDFYRRRIQRLFPAMLFVVTCTTLAGCYLFFSEELANLGKHVAAAVGFVINGVLYKEVSYFDALRGAKPLLHLWSLSVEEQFYLIWPLMLLLLYRQRWLNVYTLGALTLASWSANFWVTDQALQFYAPWLRFWEFSAGACVAFFVVNKPDKANVFSDDTRNLASVLGLLCIVLGCILTNDADRFQHARVLPGIIGICLWLVTGSNTWIAQSILMNPVLRPIGRISYSLYLWHWPILVITKMLGNESSFYKLEWILLSFILAAITYKWVEQPFLRPSWRRPAVTAGLIIYALALGSFGFYLYSSKGKMARASLEATKKIIDFGEAATDGSCQFLTRDEKRNPEDWCDIGNAPEREPRVIVIGDSFSRAFGDMLRHLNENNPDLDLVYSSMGRGRCPSLIGYGPRFCQEVVEKIYQTIASTPEIKTVVLAQQWRTYMEGVQYPEESWKESRHSYALALKESVDFIESYGKRVVVFWAPPRGRKPQFCVDRLGDFSLREDCSVSLSTAQKFDNEARRQLMTFFKNRQIAVFDPFDWLCRDQKCSVLNGKNSIYGEDGHHMSPYGAGYLADQAQAQLIKLLVAPP